jgi:hypothetical protein
MAHVMPFKMSYKAMLEKLVNVFMDTLSPCKFVLSSICH